MKKEMLINVLQPEECRIAIVEDGILEELYLERTSHESYTGNIYKGRIVNLEPGIQAAFVDFSVGRNGFLHVSDVEPQYYKKHLGDDVELGPRDRGREAPRTERDPIDSPPPPPPYRDRPEGRPRERDRPDRSEKGRRDRSEPRRFGEGLTDDDDWTPPPAPPAARKVEPPAPAPSQPPPPPPPIESFAPRRSSWAAEPSIGHVDEPPARSPDPVEADLPPSRTHRVRPSAPASRALPPEDIEELLRPRQPIATRESEADRAPRAAEPRRGRGRGGRSRSAPDPELEFRREPEPEPEPPLLAEPELDDEPEPISEERPRRGGRAAIRSRGGDREPPRPREPVREPIVERELPPTRIVREREPVADRGRPPVVPPAERPAAEADRPRREREPREPREPRVPRPAADRERPRGAHDRAGEPGYVPRRERSRPSEASTPPIEAEASSPFWAEPGEIRPSDLDELDIDRDAEFGPEGEGGEGEPKTDGPRRRRRRRRRGPRDIDAGASAPVEADFDEPAPPPLPPPPSSRPEPTRDRQPPRSRQLPPEPPPRSRQLPPEPPPRPREIAASRSAPIDREVPAFDEFDFDEGHDHDHDHDEDEVVDEVTAAAPDEEIDPELEEEIRREIEEIAELEREMGLRGTTEARPRRGDDRDAVRAPGRSARGRGLVKPPLQEIFRRGDEVLVQVIKESIGTKGPTLSTYISIPGRYLVLMPGLNRVGVSRKIADEGQRRKLREIMTDLNPPKGLGFIVRTAGLDRTKRELARDLAYLLRLWKVILRRIQKARSPAPIYQESDMITRTIRDIFSAEIDTIWIDEPAAFERAKEFLRVVMPKFVDRLKLYEGKVPLFHQYGIEDEIAKIQRRRVDLVGGGSIVIDQTEALVAIDVNSGNFRVEDDAERTAYEMNLRAAKEIARQLRLRDLGGVICNDFIDMREERHRRGVERALRDAIRRDRARTKVLRISQFGIIEMTRQRIRPSLKRSVFEDCPHCNGTGVEKTVESMSIDVMRVLAFAAHREEVRRVVVAVSSEVAAYVNNRKRQEIAKIEAEANLSITVHAEPGVARDHFHLDGFDAQNVEVRILPSPPPPPRRGR